MSSIIRRQSSTGCYLGFHQLSQATWSRYNTEFVDMAFSGSLGIPHLTRPNDLIDWRKIKAIFDLLAKEYPHLQQLNNRASLAQLHSIVSGIQTGFSAQTDGEEPDQEAAQEYPSYILPTDDLPVSWTERFENFRIGMDINQADVQYDTPALFAIMFPYFYTNGQSYYSLGNPPGALGILSEAQGGTAIPNKYNITLNKYVKQRLFMADGRL